MAFTSFVCFPLSLLLILVLAKGRNDSICPKSFSCGNNLTDLSFPFYLSPQSECGLMSLSGCDDKPYPRIQLLPGGDWYYALGMPYDDALWLVDMKFETTLKKDNCKAFNKNLSIPNYSPSISFNILPVSIQNYFKCNSTSNNTPTVAGYTLYNGCKGFNLYYMLPGEDIQEGTLPANCSLIRIPASAPEFQVEWKLSDDCHQCHYGGGRCLTNKTNKFYCHGISQNDAPTTRSKSGLILGIGTSKRGRNWIFRTTWFKVATGTIFSCVALLILLFCFREKVLCYKYLRFWDSNAEEHRKIEVFLKNHGSYALKRYSYSDIKRITNHFKNKLGQGGYGYVYRGSLINGSLVAVKVLNGLKGCGEEFINEVASISRTSHVNVVSLVGFCFEGRKRALIYEFMPNGSLEKFIYEERSDTIRQLGWPVLYQIALGIARGLEYLHRGCSTRILHFDIKPHNILLDDKFCPKISDFGLAKLCMKQESIVSMLDARGTIGYIAPEIVCRNLGGVSHKSDVYSYGMMVLEMVGGRKNVDVGVDRTSEIYFPHWLYQRIELDEELKLIGIMNEEEKECARKMVIVSLWCIQTDPSIRPSMSSVVEMLEGNLNSLQFPPKPYLYSPSRSER